MTKTQSQKGFGTVGIVGIVLVLAVLAFAGWYIWQKNNKKADTNKPNGQTSQNQNNDTKKPDEQKPADPTEGGKYLVITEWGVRFPLSEELRGDVKYQLSPAESDGSQSALFEIGKIANLPGSRCSIAPGNDGIGVALARLAEEPSASEKQAYGEQNIHHLGSYWYQETFAKAACAAEADYQKAGDARNALGVLMQQLEVVPQQ